MSICRSYENGEAFGKSGDCQVNSDLFMILSFLTWFGGI